MEKVLEVVEIKKAFGGNKVLEGVSFSAEAGKIVGIIGPNGSGKTTLINILSGVLRQDHGKVLFMGMDISHEKAYVRARLGIGRTFQIPRAFPSLTVWENLQLAQLHSGKEVSIESVLKRVGLYEFRIGILISYLWHREKGLSLQGPLCSNQSSFCLMRSLQV
jgi:branched-chain amino acid transport system ATP-binding protein